VDFSPFTRPGVAARAYREPWQRWYAGLLSGACRPLSGPPEPGLRV